MHFNIKVQTDPTTWRGGHILRPRLAAVSAGWHDEIINYPEMLLLIGELTTPVLSGGYSLAEYWAQLRYFHAVDLDNDDLLLTEAYADLDPHQKMILSDDFGMGISMLWLKEALDFEVTNVCDGSYFVKNLASRYGATVASKTNKRGPRKTPDFVARGRDGKWHVIECKGTQSGFSTLSGQISSTTRSGRPSGGIVQKRAITFPAAMAGERLVAGVSLGTVGRDFNSYLLIVDPSEEPILKLTEDQMPVALDPVIRSTVAKSLLLVGAPQLAAQIASPQMLLEREHLFVWQREDRLERREHLAQEELGRLRRRSIVWEGETRKVGRDISLPLTRPVEWGGRRYWRVDVRYLCNFDVAELAMELGRHEEPLGETDSTWKRFTGMTRFESDLPSRGREGRPEASAVLHIGDFFRSEIHLYERELGLHR